MWVSDIESAVFSRIKARGRPLKEKYPTIFFTAEEETDETVPTFPTVYVQELSGTGQGEDLDGSKTNALLSSFQINVYHNGTKSDVRYIMNNCGDTLESMRFRIINSPTYTVSNGVWKGVARFRRTIGGNDTL